MLATVLFRQIDARPAALDPLRVGLLETLRRGDDGIVPVTAFLIAGFVQRRKHLTRELGRFIEHGIDDFARRVFAAGQGGVDRLDIEHVVKHKTDIGQRCVVLAHEQSCNIG